MSVRAEHDGVGIESKVTGEDTLSATCRCQGCVTLIDLAIHSAAPQ
jgi:hypothetical protein